MLRVHGRHRGPAAGAAAEAAAQRAARAAARRARERSPRAPSSPWAGVFVYRLSVYEYGMKLRRRQSGTEGEGLTQCPNAPPERTPNLDPIFKPSWAVFSSLQTTFSNNVGYLMTSFWELSVTFCGHWGEMQNLALTYTGASFSEAVPKEQFFKGFSTWAHSASIFLKIRSFTMIF